MRALQFQSLALGNRVSNTSIQSNEQINTRVCEITQALQEAIEQSVLWARLSTRTKDYWNQECKEAVYEARQAYYDLLRERTPTTESRLKELRNRKIATIRRHQRRQFRSQLAETTKKSQGAWKLMKWAKERGGQPRPLPQLPQLIVTDRDGTKKIATTFQEKVDMLRAKFFPEPREADLTDIDGVYYPEPIETPNEVLEKEVLEALRWVANDKAPGPDQIPNRVLKAAQAWVIPRLLTVFNAALRNGYHPRE
jgi:hypothetical protein